MLRQSLHVSAPSARTELSLERTRQRLAAAGVCVGLALGTALLGGCQSLATAPPAVGEIHATHLRLAKAYSSCDAAAFVAAYADAFTFTTSNSRRAITTTDGLRAYLAAGCRLKPNPTATVTSQTVRLLGGQALVTGQYLFRVPAGDKVADVPQNFTLVFAQTAGAWVVVAHHVSVAP